MVPVPVLYLQPYCRVYRVTGYRVTEVRGGQRNTVPVLIMVPDTDPHSHADNDITVYHYCHFRVMQKHLFALQHTKDPHVYCSLCDAKFKSTSSGSYRWHK